MLSILKKHCSLLKVFIGYGLKTGQGFYPGPYFFVEASGIRNVGAGAFLTLFLFSCGSIQYASPANFSLLF